MNSPSLVPAVLFGYFIVLEGSNLEVCCFFFWFCFNLIHCNCQVKGEICNLASDLKSLDSGNC